MKVLVLQLRQLFGQVPADRDRRSIRRLAHGPRPRRGLVEGSGGAAILKYEAAGRGPLRETHEVLEHKIEVERCLALPTEPGAGALRDRCEIEAVGRCAVYRGERFKTSALLDDALPRSRCPLPRSACS